MFRICVDVTLYDLKAQLNQINGRLNHKGTIKWSMSSISVSRSTQMDALDSII